MKITKELWRSATEETRSTSTARAVLRALAELTEDAGKIRSLLSGLCVASIGEGTGRNTRGSACSVSFVESLAHGSRVLALTACCAAQLLLTSALEAQTFLTLHSFSAGSGQYPNYITNTDGAYPQPGLVLSSNTLFGTAKFGGSSSRGTVFAVNTDGTGFTTLHNFDGYPGDGAAPNGGLILSGNTLYGTTARGGDSDSGTVFAMNIDGTGFTTLYSFSSFAVTSGGLFVNSDGVYPEAGLVLSSTTLYGTANTGGDFGNGTVFAINIDGTGFEVLHTFSQGAYNSNVSYTNSDGSRPWAGLALSGIALYGTASGGGSLGQGTVFAINTDGSSFTTLHSFAGPMDGSEPQAGLFFSDNILYGTAPFGGSSDTGTLFAINTDGTGFATLHSFTDSSGVAPPYTNSDGASPVSGLTLSGHVLYGTAGGGSTGWGTVFALNTDGTGFKSTYNLRAGSTNSSGLFTNSDGCGLSTELVLSGNTLYGTASGGGNSGYGTVFSVSFKPELSITRSGPNALLTWPTNYAGFDYRGYALQSTTNFSSAANWTNVSPSPVILNGQYIVSNPISGTKQFFRLSR